MLGGHADGAVRPAIAELAQVGQEDLLKGGLHREVGEQAFQYGLGGGLVEVVQGVTQLPGESGEPAMVPGSRCVGSRRGAGRGGSPAAAGAGPWPP